MANRDDAKRLAELAVYLHGTANEIMAIADRIPRKPAVRKTKPRSDYMTITIGKQARYTSHVSIPIGVTRRSVMRFTSTPHASVKPRHQARRNGRHPQAGSLKGEQ